MERDQSSVPDQSLSWRKMCRQEGKGEGGIKKEKEKEGSRRKRRRRDQEGKGVGGIKKEKKGRREEEKKRRREEEKKRRREEEKKMLKSLSNKMKKFPFLQRTPKTAEQRQQQVKECNRQKRAAESEIEKERRLKKKKI